MTIETYQAWRRRVASAKYRAANKKKVNAAQTAYRAKYSHSRQWEKDNPDRVLAIKQDWRKKHPGAVRAINASRRVMARKQRCTCCTNADIKRIYETAALTGYDVDHIRPLALGGPHCARNLQILSIDEHKKKTKQDQIDIAEYRRRL
jgi:hypothetical protein